MTRRTAAQALVAVVAGAMDPDQKTTPTHAPTTSTTGSTWSLADISQPPSLHVYLNWKVITIQRGDESVTLDQEELFRALKGAV